MSTLKVNNLQDVNGANNSTPEQVAQGRAKSWVNFNGDGTVAIRDDFNVSSITDNGTGDYTVTFSSAMPNANYAVALSHKEDTTDTTGSGARPMMRRGAAGFYSTTAVRVINSNTQNGLGVDAMIFNVIVFGD